MASESKWESVVDSNIFSIIGALFGGFTGSLASRAFGGTTASDFFTGVFILGIGAVLGVMVGIRLSEGLIREHFGRPAEKRFRNIGSVGVAFFGFVIAMGGSLALAISIESEFFTSGFTLGLIGGVLFSLLLYLIGFAVMLWGLGYTPEQIIN